MTIGVIVALACAGYCLKDLAINPDVVDYFPDDDPAVQRFRAVGEQYAATTTASIALETEDVFTLPALRCIQHLTDSAAALDGVASVTSLTAVLDIRDSEGALEVARLVDPAALPATPDSLEALRRRALAERLIAGNLVSKDSRSAIVVCRLAPDAEQVAVAESLRAMAERTSAPGRLYYAGFPFQMRLVGRIVVRDLMRLVPISSLVVTAALAAGFRCLAGVVLPLLTVLSSVVLTLGAMAGLRVPLTVISDAIPVILIAVGSAYGIHVVNRLAEIDMRDEPRVAEALGSVAAPVLLSGLTTLVGFLSFMFGSYLTLIREFGVFSAVGIALAMVVALSVIPALMRLFPHGGGHTAAPEDSRGQRMLDALGRRVYDRCRLVAAAGVCCALVAAAGIPRIERNASILDYFKPQTDIRQAEALLEKRFGGTIPFAVVVQGDLDNPQQLSAMARLRRRLAALPELHGVHAVTDLLEEMNELMGEGRRIPDSRERIANLWFMLEGQEEAARLIRSDHTEAVIRGNLSRLDTRKVRGVVREIEKCLENARAEGLKVYQTGLHIIYRDLDRSIVRTLYWSLAVCVVLIYLCLVGMVRSPGMAVFGLIPVGVGLSANFGVMGWLGIPLDVVTVLIGSVSAGIGVDYAIHFVARYREEAGRRACVRDAIAVTMRSTGRAIAINAVTVMAGFLVLTLAELIPLRQFGLLAAVTMAASAAGALTVLPAALAWWAQRDTGERQGGTICR